MRAVFQKYTLHFKFDAGTSRGVLRSKDSWFLKIFNENKPEIFGIGECGPLPGLSPDLHGDVEKEATDLIEKLSKIHESEAIIVDQLVPPAFPALRFALETALLDLQNGGRRMICQNDFSHGKIPIPINGLVWMGDRELMRKRIDEKLRDGFDCIKIKIGAINFEDELSLIRYIREQYSPEQVTIRLDANGAFAPREALYKLEKLSVFHIHSIEQPIRQGQWKAMAELCQYAPVPVALDEELIGISGVHEKKAILKQIKPAYIILKPTLTGGLRHSAEWIRLAEERGIGWWVTSALESSIGLNAIAQFTANYPVTLPQGLGTGRLFHNNIPSPLSMRNGQLWYDPSGGWDLRMPDG